MLGKVLCLKSLTSINLKELFLQASVFWNSDTVSEWSLSKNGGALGRQAGMDKGCWGWLTTSWAWGSSSQSAWCYYQMQLRHRSLKDLNTKKWKKKTKKGFLRSLGVVRFWMRKCCSCLIAKYFSYWFFKLLLLYPPRFKWGLIHCGQ